MDTISFWKRALSSELLSKVNNDNISALFNSLMFIRALEDYERRKNPNSKQLLVEKWLANRNHAKTMRTCIMSCIKSLGKRNIPRWLLDERKLKVFDALDEDTVLDIFRDFYINKFARYQYDFSLMSKHALSRICEHYVSLLSKESPQKKLFEDLPEEVSNRTLGVIFTPQYIAKFFARYLKQNLTPIVFRSLKTADPSCGSGIFLRTLLEMQCDPLQEVYMRDPTQKAFSNIMGIDIDENACQLTRLSISLLHLVLTGYFPKSLNIVDSEAIDFFINNQQLSKSYDVIIANPPFLKWGKLKEVQKSTIKEYFKKYSKGKIDMYLAMLKLGMELVKNGGHILYVLPHSFLIAQNAMKLRQEIASQFWIRFIVDLSDIDVFEGVGSYVILLILQKKLPNDIAESDAVIVKCRESAGEALQSALEGQRIATDFYDIYETDQSTFQENQWQVLSPKQMLLKTKISKFPVLEEFLIIKVGFVTAADDIFIRNYSDIPNSEKKIYIPYLRDREMEKYYVPSDTSKVVFYPYLNNVKLNENDIADKFPKTWAYLKSHSKSLKSRKTAQTTPWWSPDRPRPPKDILVPKIISPHLVLLSKFSLDEEGKYGVSRCPIMYPKNPKGGIDLLYYFLAILNSSIVFWQIANMSHKYSRGYFMLEPKTLKQIRVPDPAAIPPVTFKKILRSVKEVIQNPSFENESEIDNLVADLYSLSKNDRNEIGMGE